MIRYSSTARPPEAGGASAFSATVGGRWPRGNAVRDPRELFGPHPAEDIAVMGEETPPRKVGGSAGGAASIPDALHWSQAHGCAARARSSGNPVFRFTSAGHDAANGAAPGSRHGHDPPPSGDAAASSPSGSGGSRTRALISSISITLAAMQGLARLMASRGKRMCFSRMIVASGRNASGRPRRRRGRPGPPSPGCVEADIHVVVVQFTC